MTARPDGLDDDLPDHVLRWLEAAQRRIGSELDAALEERVRRLGVRRIRVLQLIPRGGARQQELAERALVSKQAMAEAVVALESEGVADRLADPADGRAWLVVRSERGDRVCQAMDAAMERVERDLANQVGPLRYAAFKDVLRELGAEQI